MYAQVAFKGDMRDGSFFAKDLKLLGGRVTNTACHIPSLFVFFQNYFLEFFELPSVDKREPSDK